MLLLQVLLLVSAFGAPAGSTTAWVKRNPNPTAARLTQVAYGAGKFVVAGSSETSIQLLYSDDALNWKEAVLPWNMPRSYLNSYTYNVVYDEKLGFVALCDSHSAGSGGDNPGAVLLSTDGITWRAYPNKNLFADNPVAGNGVVFAGGRDRGFVVSTNGINYTQASPPSWAATVAFIDGQFLAYGFDHHVYQSSNASSWTVLMNFNTVFPQVAQAVCVCIAGSKSGPWVALLQTGYPVPRSFIVRSDDGNSWQNVTELQRGIDQAALARIDNVFIFSLLQMNLPMYFIRSSDGGRSWVNASSDIRQTVTAVGGRFVASWGNAPLSPFYGGLIQVSTDLGVTWRAHNNGITENIIGMANADDRLVLATADGVYASTDGGVTWERKSSISLAGINYDPTRKIYSGALSVDQAQPGHSLIASSTDLSRWAVIPGPVTDTYVHLVAWQATGAVLTPAGWVVAIWYYKHKPPPSSSDSSNSSSSSSSSSSLLCCMESRVYVSNATGGWQHIVTFDKHRTGGLSFANGLLVLELYGTLVGSRDNGGTWFKIRNDSCDLYRGGNMLFSVCLEQWPRTSIHYAFESDVTNWRTTQGGEGAQGVSWLAPNSNMPQGKFVAAGWNGTMWESVDGTTFVPAPRINNISVFTMMAATSKGVVAISALDNMIYTAEAY